MTSLIKPKAAARVVAASEYRLPGRQERAVASNGELNASNKVDLLRASLTFAESAGKGEVDLDGNVLSRERRMKEAASRQELVIAAMRDPQVHRELGEQIAEELYVTTNRKGYSRRFMVPITLKQGDIPRFPVRQKNVNAFYLSGPGRIETQVALDRWLTPPEGQIATRVFIPQNELNQSNTDVLGEKAVEALEGIMVTEDRFWYDMVQASIGVDNNQALISGTLSPLSLMSVRQNVVRWGLKAAYCLMASDLFVDIVGDASFIQAIEPVARHELVMTGELAVLYGMTLISESYRHPEHKVLNEGEFIVVSEALTHGAYSDRGGVDSAPLDGVSENVLGKGWLMSESWSAVVANARSVAVGRRV